MRGSRFVDEIFSNLDLIGLLILVKSGSILVGVFDGGDLLVCHPCQGHSTRLSHPGRTSLGFAISNFVRGLC